MFLYRYYVLVNENTLFQANLNMTNARYCFVFNTNVNLRSKKKSYYNRTLTTLRIFNRIKAFCQLHVYASEIMFPIHYESNPVSIID